MNSDQVPVTPSCGHAIHLSCLRKWLAAQVGVSTCPSCRAVLAPDLVNLVDIGRNARLIVNGLGELRAGSTTWRVDGYRDLVELLTAVEDLVIRRHASIASWEPWRHECFTFRSASKTWSLHPDANPLSELVTLLGVGSGIVAEYVDARTRDMEQERALKKEIREKRRSGLGLFFAN